MGSDFRHRHDLSLRLAESAVFLRSRDSLSHRSNVDNQPGILRGLLILHLEKPMKITSILLTLRCLTTTTWPEGLGPRRLDISETHDVFSYDQIFFKAQPMDRRRSSVGPGVRIRSGQGSRPTSSDGSTRQFHQFDPSIARRRSTDLSNFQAEAIEQRQSQIHLPDHIHSSSSRNPELPSVVEQPPSISSEPSEYSHDSTALSSASSIHLSSTPMSPRRSFDGDLTLSPSSASSRAGLGFDPSPRLSPRTFPRSPSSESSGRRPHTGLSLGAVSNALYEALHSPTYPPTGGEPSRDSSPESSEGRGRSGGIREIPDDRVFTRTVDKLKMYGHSRKHSDVEEWKEFRPGTYTYAITIPIPADQPPSLECAFGSVEWTLKATVHRPGTFKSKLTRSMKVNVIHSPIDEDQDESDSIMVERHWEQQLQYLVGLSARHFYIGGTVPFALTLLPLSKAKIHRLTVYIEERVDYLTQMSRVVRNDPKTHILLLSIKNPTRNISTPILPLDSDDPEAFQKSPLYQMIDPDDDPSEFASNFMGPGPWTFRKDLQLPSSCSALHWTNKNKRSNILITHMLKCVIRVERGDDHEVDKAGKRKLYDIIIQTDVEIRSCHCNPEWAGLPPYTETFQDHLYVQDKCPCEIYRRQHDQSTPGPSRGIASRTSTSDSDVSSAETSPIDGTMASLRGTNVIYRDNVQYERLVSGRETESGEIPPPY